MKLTTMEKAIATIQEYCRKHQCSKCKYSAYGVTRCLFQSDVPRLGRRFRKVAERSGGIR